MISRRKTIGTICDAIAKNGTEKAIRRVVKGSESLAAFARKTKQAAAAVPRSKRFGEDLIYISDVGTGKPFKERLFEAYQNDLIELAKADMPQALPAGKLRDSAVEGRTVTYHFIRVR